MTNKAIDHQQTVCQYCFHAEFNLFSSVNCYFKPSFITLKLNSICQYKEIPLAARRCTELEVTF